MGNFCAVANGGIFHLNEVANLHPVADMAVRADIRERPNGGFVADFGFDCRRGLEFHAIAKLGICQSGIGADFAVLPDFRIALQHTAGQNHRIHTNFNITADIGIFGIHEGNTAFHVLTVDAVLHDFCSFRKLYTAVYTEKFIGILCHNSLHLAACLQNQLQTICQVIFPLRVIVIQLAQGFLQFPAVENINPCVDFVNHSLCICCILMLHNAFKAAVVIAHDASVAGRILYFRGNHSYAVSLCTVYLNQLCQGFACNQRRIPVENQHITAFINKIACHHNSMSCALLLCLQSKGDAFRADACLNLLRLMPNHNANVLCATAFCGFNHIIHHALIQNFMEYLRFLGFHTGAFAGSQNDCFQLSHLFFLLRQRAKYFSRYCIHTF